MTKSEIKIGDRVREKENPCRFGVITSINHYNDPDCLVVRFDNEDERVRYVTDLEIYPDRKTAFLTELRELLRKYDAKICGGLSDISEKDVVFILIGDNDKVKYLNGTSDTYAHINVDNIMEFGKE